MSPSSPATPCPICGTPAEPALRPFCSRRCADVDLNRWLSGTYVLPGIEGDDEAESIIDAPAPPLSPRE